MKKIAYLLILLSLNVFTQNKYLTKTGIVDFEASVPSFEEVKAKNNTATAIINTDTGEFAALVLIKGFRFKNALMEEHFNENYAESHKFPKATFKGKLNNYDSNNIIDSYTLNGELTFHGVTKPLVDVPVTLNMDDSTISVSGEFVTNASEFNIDIPKIVRNKIAQDVTVSFNFDLKKQ